MDQQQCYIPTVRRIGMIIGSILALVGAYLAVSSFAVVMALSGPWLQIPVEGDWSRMLATLMLMVAAAGSFLFVASWRRTSGLGWLLALALPPVALLSLTMAFASSIALVVILVLIVGLVIPAGIGFAAGAVSASLRSSRRPVNTSP